jgi:lipopolysaccharide heptosyltransferase I
VPGVRVPKDILIIKPSSIGDVVHGLPVLAKLRARYPKARISWLVGTAAAPLVESNPLLDRVYYFRRGERGLKNAIGRHVALVRELAWAGFDCVIDLQGLLRSALFAYATGADMRVGLADAREGARLFYTHTVALNGARHAVDRYLAVGKVLDFDPGGAEFGLDAPAAAKRSVETFVEKAAGSPARPHILLSPGARWASKCWPAEKFADAAEGLRKRVGGTYFLVGARSADEDGKVISERLGRSCVNLIGRTSLEELVALVSRADMLVTADTGVLHIADAVGTPVVAVFGPTDPEKTGPYSQRERVVQARGTCPKMPCFERECRTMKCMGAVSGREVAERAAEALEGLL